MHARSWLTYRVALFWNLGQVNVRSNVDPATTVVAAGHVTLIMPNQQAGQVG